MAYILGNRTDNIFVELKKRLEVFGIKKFFTDNRGAYERHLPPEKHEIGKRNTQKIERKHLTLRTRIKMHDILIGLFINRYEFGKAI